MRKFLIVLALTGICLSLTAAWEPIGPYGGYLRAMAVAQSNEDVMFVASNSSPGKIFKSTDGGNNWDKTGSVSYSVYCLAVDPNNPDVVYAGSYMRVYKSTDGGSNWVSHTISNCNGYINAVSGHPTSSSTVYAVGSAKSGTKNAMAFFKSTNGGSDWSTVTLDTLTGNSYSIAIDPSDPNTIYVGGNSQTTSFIPKVFKSTNGGTSFTDASSGISSSAYYVYSLAVHPTNPNYVYAGTYYGGIYRSTNGGSSWSIVGSYKYIYSLSTTKADPNIVFAGDYSYVYKSTNSGSSWTSLSSGLKGYYFRGIYVSQTQTSRVFAANNTGFFKSTNSGSSWSPSNDGINLATINAFAVAPSAPATIYCDVDNFGTYKSTNGGMDWTLLPSYLSCGNICAVAIHNTTPNTVFCLEGAG